MAIPDQGDDPFQRIAHRAWRRNRDRAASLTEILAAGASVALAEPIRQQAILLAHQVCGSAGTFGHETAAEIAARIEDLLRRTDSVGAPPGPELIELSSALAQHLLTEPRLD